MELDQDVDVHSNLREPPDPEEGNGTIPRCSNVCPKLDFVVQRYTDTGQERCLACQAGRVFTEFDHLSFADFSLLVSKAATCSLRQLHIKYLQLEVPKILLLAYLCLKQQIFHLSLSITFPFLLYHLTTPC
jgi:hypothetical protein